VETVSERIDRIESPGEGVPAVQLDRVSKSFGTRTVLDDISFEVPPGCGFVILGRSGTGKSVTLRLIIGLLKPDSGHVLVHGEEVNRLKGADLSRVRRNIGFLFQNAALFDSISVGENVAFPLRRHTRLRDGEIRAIAQQKLESVGLGAEYDKMPAALSGGMRKRAALARALALDPQLLLVDEPSAGLDPITADEIDELLLNLKRHGGATLVVVTHNISSAKRLADRMIMLHEGRIVASGTPAELALSSQDLVRAFMSSQHAG
jgi:phospholipid/cholesterol/gamma-HCH transport system ATP-binding protein